MRPNKTHWRAIRRYFFLFSAIALLPLALVYLVTNEQIYKIKGFEDAVQEETQKLVLVQSSSDVSSISNNQTNAAVHEHKIEHEHENEKEKTNQKQKPDKEKSRKSIDATTMRTGYKKKPFSDSSFRYPLLLIGPIKQLGQKTIGNPRKRFPKLEDYLNDTRIPIIPDESIQTLSPSDMSMVEQRMDKRRKHLAEKCSEHGLDSPGNDSWHKPNPWEFIINRRYHIIWCNVFKAASSSWMYNFNILAGYTPEFLKKTNEVALSLARKRYPRVSLEELQEAQNDSITFIIARHPFERLLSAYRDKFMYAVPHSFHDKLGSKIVRTYRKKTKGDRHSPRYPTFSEFVTWLLEEIRRNNFIDMHLVPASKFCTPCLINVDVIIKFETLEHDQIYLIDKAGLKHIIAPEWRNSGKGKNTLDLLQTFYSQLTRKQLDGLYDYYKYDFEIFNYNATPYFSIVKKNEDKLKGS